MENRPTVALVTGSIWPSRAIQCDPYRLTVRAKAGDLRVIAAWQILGCEAHQADHVRIRVDSSRCDEEVTISFAAVSPIHSRL